MLDWLDSIAGPDYAPAIMWTFGALVLLVIVLVIIKLIRGLTFGTFVAGGRNRKTRLAVMDATAIDSHRRLVLVRRDDIEHLLLIGGPTDVVVERDIRLAGPRRAALTGDAGHPPIAAPKPRAPQPAPATPVRPAPSRQHQTPAPLRDSASVSPLPQTNQSVVSPQASGSTAIAAVRPPPLPVPIRDPIDDTLMNELEVTLDDTGASRPVAKPSLDDEMTKLLGELSVHKRVASSDQ